MPISFDGGEYSRCHSDQKTLIPNATVKAEMHLQATPQEVLVQGSSPRHRLTPEGLGRGWMRFCTLSQWLRDYWVFGLIGVYVVVTKERLNSA